MPIDLLNILTFGLYQKHNTFISNMYNERLQIQREHIKHIEQAHLKYSDELKSATFQIAKSGGQIEKSFQGIVLLFFVKFIFI
jgi:hypothetical protein